MAGAARYRMPKPRLRNVRRRARSAFELERNPHLWIVFNAAQLIRDEGANGRRLYDLVKPNQGKISDAFHDSLCQALHDADRKSPYNNSVLPFGLLPTWRSHFYDPDTEANYLGQSSPTAVTCGSKYYHLSRDAYLTGDLKMAGYWLGLSLHYMTDLTQPMHAANFTWLDSRHFGYHTAFEQYVKKVLHRIAPPETYSPRAMGAIPDGYLQSVARITKDAFYDAICKPEWTQSFGRQTNHEAIWQERLGHHLTPILHEAVLLTAQYLLTWIDSLLEDSTAKDAAPIPQIAA